MKSFFVSAILIACSQTAWGQYNQFWGLSLCMATPADVRAKAAKNGTAALPSSTSNRLEYLGTFDGMPEVRLVFDYVAPYDMGQKDSVIYGAYAVFENRSDSALLTLFQAYRQKFADKYQVPCVGCDSASLAEVPQRIRSGRDFVVYWQSNAATDPYTHAIRFHNAAGTKQLSLGCTNIGVRKDDSGLSLPYDLKNGSQEY